MHTKTPKHTTYVITREKIVKKCNMILKRKNMHNLTILSSFIKKVPIPNNNAYYCRKLPKHAQYICM